MRFLFIIVASYQRVRRLLLLEGVKVEIHPNVEVDQKAGATTGRL